MNGCEMVEQKKKDRKNGLILNFFWCINNRITNEKNRIPLKGD